MEQVEEVLGFQPADLMDQLFSDIDDELDNTVGKLKNELVKVAQKNGIAASDLDEPCEALKTALMKIFHHNLDRFELYSYRNIFVAPGADGASGPGISRDVAATTEDLNALRHKYNATRERHGAMARDVAACEAVMNEMKTALFNIRVGAQTLDAHKVQPLDETAALLAQYKSDVMSLMSKAEALTAHMRDGAPTERGDSSGIIESSIKSGDAAQIQRLSRQMA